MAKIITNSSYLESIERTNAGADATSLSKMNVVNYRMSFNPKSSFRGFPTVLADIEKENRKNITTGSFSGKNQQIGDFSAILDDNLAAMERYDRLVLGHPTNYKAFFNIPPPLPQQTTVGVLSNLDSEIPKADRVVPISKVNPPPSDNNLAPNGESTFKQPEGVKSYLENAIQKHSDKIREYLSGLVKKDTADINQTLNNREQAGASAGNKKESEIQKIIKIAGQYHGLDPTLALAVAKTESSLRPNAVSNDGHESKGIFQLLDGTAANMIKRLKIQEQYQPFDPKMNSHLGVGYLRYLHDIFSQDTKINANMVTSRANSQEDLEKLALAAYNAGEGKVIQAQEKAKSQGENPGDFDAVKKFLPEVTRGYVVKVSSYKKEINESSQI